MLWYQQLYAAHVVVAVESRGVALNVVVAYIGDRTMHPCWLFVAGVAVVVASLTSRPVAALGLGPCETRDNMVAALADGYQEIPVALGVTTTGSLVEVLKNTAEKTWTIIVTSPQGISCLVFSGDGWREQKHPLAEPGA